MNGSYNELGRAFMEQERQKEEQKRANQQTKMRMEMLQQQAQSYDDQQKGYQQAAETIDPILRIHEANVNRAMADAAESKRRQSLAEYMALAMASTPKAEGGMSADTMRDVHTHFQNMMRLQVLSGLAKGEYPPEPVLKALFSGVEHPAAQARAAGAELMKEERKDIRSTISAYSKSWNDEMDALATWRRKQEAEMGELTPEQEEMINLQTFALTSRYIDMIEDAGVPAPGPMYELIGREQPKAPQVTPGARAQKIPAFPADYPGGVRRTREPHRGKGGKVYKERSDITYGTEPGYEEQTLTPGAESAILHDSYASVIRETFPTMNDAEIDSMVESMMAEEPPSPRSTTDIGEMKRKYPHLTQMFKGERAGFSPEIEKAIEEMRRREKRRRQVGRASTMPMRGMADIAEFLKRFTPGKPRLIKGYEYEPGK